MSEFPLGKNATVVMSDCEFFPLESKVKFISQISETILFVTWLDPANGGLERPLANGCQEQNQFDGEFSEGKSEFRVLVQRVELGARRLLIGSVQKSNSFEEAADTFVAEEDDDFADEGDDRMDHIRPKRGARSPRQGPGNT